MLLIIVPVIVMTLVFAWRYRASNKDAPYTPDWDHSIQLELLIWSAPLLIIIALGALTWIGTHTLDPFRPLDVKQAPRDLPPLEIQVVALDWNWLFIYPEHNIAMVNELAAPVTYPCASDHVFLGDEFVLRPGAGGPDLRHAEHGDHCCTPSSTGPASTRASLRTTAAPVSTACGSGFSA